MSKVLKKDEAEVERLMKIYQDVMPYVEDLYASYKLMLDKGALYVAINGECEIEGKNRNEILEMVTNHFNLTIEDVETVCHIDDNLNVNCVRCENCTKCIKCVDCSNCDECCLCFRCHDCKNTINRRNQEGLVNDDSHYPLIVNETFVPDDISLEAELKE